VALRYDTAKDRSPTVTAKGRGTVAEKIIELAKKHKIPIKDDPDLVEVLSRLDIDREIPPELYHVIAEVFAFVYSINQKWANRK
ncbi:MAG: EscU/YscU/HrcU family type III secretion system export apparatus switch protein, partial [Deltaproteobacteria bacterium]|nr:EscU/YscU/HrcU family type III secretion system export apparatus switch protein [Deltaproteobacteria bacterium]